MRVSVFFSMWVFFRKNPFGPIVGSFQSYSCVLSSLEEKYTLNYLVHSFVIAVLGIQHTCFKFFAYSLRVYDDSVEKWAVSMLVRPSVGPRMSSHWNLNVQSNRSRWKGFQFLSLNSLDSFPKFRSLRRNPCTLGHLSPRKKLIESGTLHSKVVTSNI